MWLLFQNTIAESFNGWVNCCMQQFMYHAVNAECAGGEYQLIFNRIVVSGVRAFDWIDHDFDSSNR